MTDIQNLAVGLLRSGDRILLVKEAYGLHLWTLPSGYVEAGETFSEAAVRETREETGLETQVRGIIAVRERADQLVIAFALEQCGGSLLESVPGEIEATKWFHRDEFHREKRNVNDFSAWLVSRAFQSDLEALRYTRWKGRFEREAALYGA